MTFAQPFRITLQTNLSDAMSPAGFAMDFSFAWAAPPQGFVPAPPQPLPQPSDSVAHGLTPQIDTPFPLANADFALSWADLWPPGLAEPPLSLPIAANQAGPAAPVTPTDHGPLALPSAPIPALPVALLGIGPLEIPKVPLLPLPERPVLPDDPAALAVPLVGAPLALVPAPALPWLGLNPPDIPMMPPHPLLADWML